MMMIDGSMDLSQATPALLESLATAQSRVREVGKDARHSSRGYTYATADAMIAAGREARAGTGLALITAWRWVRPPEEKAAGEQWIGAIVLPMFSGFGAEAIASRLRDGDATVLGRGQLR